MTQKSETSFKVQVQRDLDELPRTWHEKIQQISIRGTPDLLVCCNGWFVALELKASADANIDRLQTYKLTKITEAGGLAYVTHPDNWKATLADIVRRCLKGVALKTNHKH